MNLEPDWFDAQPYVAEFRVTLGRRDPEEVLVKAFSEGFGVTLKTFRKVCVNGEWTWSEFKLEDDREYDQLVEEAGEYFA